MFCFLVLVIVCIDLYWYQCIPRQKAKKIVIKLK